MNKIFGPIIFGAFMFVLGVDILYFHDKISSLVDRVTGEKDNNVTQTILSMRFGGVVAILIGLFTLWMSWKNR